MATQDNADFIKDNSPGYNTSQAMMSLQADSMTQFFNLVDSFNRLRVSNPYTIWDSKCLNQDYNGLFWDNKVTAGGTATYSAVEASYTLAVTTTGDKVIRQSKMWHNYQPGKSQLIEMTGTLGSTVNVRKRIGPFYDDTGAGTGGNGLYFEKDIDNTIYVVIRKNGAVRARVAQANWNLDKMDGTGVSKHTLNPAKAQIFCFSYEWLGVGSPVFGFVIDGAFCPVHIYLNANVNDDVYMSTPNLPCRFEIESFGAAGTMRAVCADVKSEGGLDPNGTPRCFKHDAPLVSIANTINVFYMIGGIRLRTDCRGATVVMKHLSVLSQAADNYKWFLCLNPTYSSAPTWANKTSSVVQEAYSDGTITLTSPGTVLDGGLGVDVMRITTHRLESNLRIGSKIDGTMDELVLALYPITTNASYYGNINWIEMF